MAARQRWILVAEASHTEPSSFPSEVLDALSASYDLKIGDVQTGTMEGQFRLGLSTSKRVADADYTLEFRAHRRAVDSRDFTRPIQHHEVLDIEDRLGWRARLGMYARPWLDAILGGEDQEDALPPEPRFLIEELLYAVSVTILENNALLDHIDEQDLLINQLRNHIASLELELRRKEVSSERVRPSVRFIRSVALAIISGIASGGVTVAGDAMLAQAPVVQVHNVQRMVVEQPDLTQQLNEVLARCDRVVQSVGPADPTP